METFGKRLREALKQAGLSQMDLAKETGYSKATVSYWVNDKELPSIDVLIKICHFLGCSADKLLGLNPTKAEEFDHKGIKWIERIPENVTGRQKREVELGIELFRCLVVENLDLDVARAKDIFQEYDLPFLYLAFKAALRLGAFRLTQVPRDYEREERLKKAFGLRDAIVASIPQKNDGTFIRVEFVAFLAATQAITNMKGQKFVGLGSGYTLLRMAEQCVPSIEQFMGTRWVPLVTYAEQNNSSRSANYIASTLSNRYPGSEALYLPYLYTECSKEDRQMYADIITACENTNAIYLTVNGIGRRTRAADTIDPQAQFRSADYVEFSKLKDIYSTLMERRLDEQLAGELLGLMLDAQGQIIGGQEIELESKQAATRISLDTLRTIVTRGRVWIVAARAYKAQATLMALRNQFANALVVDTEIADYLLVQEG